MKVMTMSKELYTHDKRSLTHEKLYKVNLAIMNSSIYVTEVGMHVRRHTREQPYMIPIQN